jgi:mono/diheme cytochrome c family protein
MAARFAFRTPPWQPLGALLLAVSCGNAAAAPESPGNVVAGRELFVQRCAMCHGEKADGQSKLAQMLDPRPANLLISQLDSVARNRIVRSGGAAVGRSPAMPNWSAELTETELRDVIAYVASIAPSVASRPAGERP